MDPGSGGGGGGGSSSSGSSSDSAPDCWDQADMEAPGSGPCGGEGGPLAAGAAEAQREHLSAAFSRQLNVNAKPFVPNVHAAEFVPSFLRGPAQPAPAPAPTTTEPAVAREALRAKGPGRGSSRAGGRSPPWWGVGTRLRFASQGGLPTRTENRMGRRGPAAISTMRPRRGTTGTRRWVGVERARLKELGGRAPDFSFTLCLGSNSVVSMELSEPVVENGETEMSPEESWEHKEDISEAEPVGGSLGGGRPPEESAQEMIEEEEDIPKPKSVVAPPGAPKKEHVNVVFIGHVDAGKSTIGGQIILIL
ncbi:Eukaryotic Peptide Chain Release Factor Gtp-Binding Subunit Erf3B [Manis pentadactyla]|nr:Eukaryotic Peptide Chain Release Factor Gtp-Binding Subunit Erf3B [Manis pentadactyla]